MDQNESRMPVLVQEGRKSTNLDLSVKWSPDLVEVYEWNFYPERPERIELCAATAGGGDLPRAGAVKSGTKLDPDKEIQSRLLFILTANIHS